MPQAFDVTAARNAGYSDDEILSHLTSTKKFDLSGALAAGYSKEDIIGHLTGKEFIRSSVTEGMTETLRRATGSFFPPPAPPTWEEAASYLPVAGGAVGGLIGNVPGALVGGMAGRTVEQVLKARFGIGEVPRSPTEAALDVAMEGGKQAAYELGGRAVAAGVGAGVQAIRGVKAPPVGEVIGGTHMPETVGQVWGKPRGLIQTAEHYISGTFLGGPLKAVKAAQEAASRQIMADLSHMVKAEPTALAANWARAREATKIAADPLYESLGPIEVPSVRKVAQAILDDETIRLSAKAKQTLGVLAGGKMDPATAKTLDGWAKGLGYKNFQAALADKGEVGIRRELPADLVDAALQAKATVREALDARHELGELASVSKDARDRSLLGAARNDLDRAINSHLTPEQIEVKKQADLLWRRSKIMNEVSKGLERMENRQIPGADPALITSNFIQMVNKLARPEITKIGNQIVTKPSNLDILFDNPADRKAMVDLARFLATKGSTLTGVAGLSEAIARIGVTLEALSIPTMFALGHPVAAKTAGATLVSLYALSKILSNPGGAKMLATYFKSAPAAQVVLAARLVGVTEDLTAPRPPSQVTVQNPAEWKSPPTPPSAPARP